MIPVKRACRFNQDWLRKEKFKPWLETHKTFVLYAHCKFCKVDIHLGSMRLGSVESHMKGKKHSMRLTPQSASIQGWLGQTSDGSVAASANSSLTQDSSAQPSLSLTEITKSTTSTIAISLPSVNTDLTIIPFVTSEQTLRSEIIWALHNTVTHQSFTSSQAANELSINMFSDSEIAKKFSCGKTKLSYLVTFGLAPYFSSDVIAKLHDSSNFVIFFDESFNRISKDEQMDVHVRF